MSYFIKNFRFKSRLVRCLASGVYILRQICALGVTVYTPSVALSAVLGLPYWISIVGISIICIIFTVFVSTRFLDSSNSIFLKFLYFWKEKFLYFSFYSSFSFCNSLQSSSAHFTTNCKLKESTNNYGLLENPCGHVLVLISLFFPFPLLFAIAKRENFY